MNVQMNYFDGSGYQELNPITLSNNLKGMIVENIQYTGNGQNYFDLWFSYINTFNVILLSSSPYYGISILGEKRASDNKQGGGLFIYYNYKTILAEKDAVIFLFSLGSILCQPKRVSIWDGQVYGELQISNFFQSILRKDIINQLNQNGNKYYCTAIGHT